MRNGIVKKILLTVMAVVMIFTAAACDKTETQDTTLPTLAPEETQAVTTTGTDPTAEPTATKEPISPLVFWGTEPDKDVYNILLLGLDELEGTVWARNDTTMVLQLNLKTYEMKLVSFMRDMLVEIPGHGLYRINNAHYRGGPELAVQTMKSVFDIDIDYYATVDFVAFEQIMRLIGTIQIQVEEYEVEHLKTADSAVSVDGEQILGQGVVQSAGTYKFNEYLALSYARDRHSSGDDGEKAGDYGRNERQREVVKAAWTKVKQHELASKLTSVFAAIGYSDTNIEPALLITMLKIMIENDAQITDLAMPVKGYFWSVWIDPDTDVTYKDDELEALYQSKKDAYDQSNTDGTAEAFPSYSDWRTENKYANAIEWRSANKNFYTLNDFLGID